MTLVLRGRVLTFLEAPQGPDDAASYRFWEDGAVAIEGGKIVSVGQFRPGQGDEVVDHRPGLIMAGFIDPHIHYPQTGIVGSYAPDLLQWLNTHTFPEEARFVDPAYAQEVAQRFFDALIRHGTTTAAAFCTVHPVSVDAFFAEAERRGMLMIGGKVMMDCNAPPNLTDTPQRGYDESKALIGRWHGRGRALYAVSPRFAITSTPEQLEMAEALCREHPECYLQTHLSESPGEIELVRELFPNSADYTAVYERYHLLGPKSLFGHCIHLSHRETEALAETESVAVFCPTSNLFLGSGLFDYARLTGRGVRVALATDIGGGTSFSLLKTMDEAYKVTQMRGGRLDPLRVFYQATLGNARALSLDGTIGSIVPGAAADLVVLDSRAAEEMAPRVARCESLVEELFVLQTLGDDRAVAEVYVAGRPMKGGAGR